ncbi:mechanosensitive ion channel family protein [Marinactinospora thermotolerans]|uniref:Small-conductance mechanosensitive channel n=1 Tax=Marinactinospora thermotolerans DSM 45154 TaxID=1122192 RepID=A0A1T4S1W8_9ACTN|nr:mechanosensitive ion channel domain-containing protein [Marinactinospora thermotolerans]SKA22076.1 Small-conductance mechanosensitive channel [Marinactinospora thermotolerans DSM 45154]
MPLESWIALGVCIAVAVGLVSAVHWLLTHQLSKVWGNVRPLVQRCRYPAYASAVVIGANIALPGRSAFDERSWYLAFEHGMQIAMVASITWLALSIAYAITDIVLDRLAVHNGDADRRARRLQTQVKLLRRVIATIIGVLAVAAILFTFPAVRALGAGLLASAGLIGIVAGVAAQSTLGNLFAGLQLAFSDALRINDIVVFQGEWGRVEELSLTNVTLRLWDERRLVLPVSHFTTNPFENWTKQGTPITGAVLLRVDWEVPIDKIRAEVGSFVSAHPLWDGRRWSLQATDVLESGLIELRAVVTTADADARWDLCCDLREHLVTYIRTNFPESLPRNRTQFIGRERGEPYASLWPSSRLRDQAARQDRDAEEPEE